eukprot:2433358-Pleurochrysis_carterae.AAC.1
MAEARTEAMERALVHWRIEGARPRTGAPHKPGTSDAGAEGNAAGGLHGGSATARGADGGAGAEATTGHRGDRTAEQRGSGWRSWTRPRPTFPGIEEDGGVTVTTDASAVEGVGGYAFIAGRDGEVWLTSEMWPADVQSALTRAAATEAERAAERAQLGAAEETQGLSMPAAELFGIWAVARAATTMAMTLPRAVVAVGDCQPAAAAVNAAASGIKRADACAAPGGARPHIVVASSSGA